MARVQHSNIIMKERRRLTFFGLPFTFKVYILTDKKLIYKEGFLNQIEEEILLYRIVDLSKRRSFSQRIFGLGTLTVLASDKTTPKLELINIKHMDEFHAFLSERVEQERLRVRFRSAEVIDSHSGHFHDGGDGSGDDFLYGGDGVGGGMI